LSFFKQIFHKKTSYALKIEGIIGFNPKQLSLYKQAFLHKSVLEEANKKAFESNERLEFLGDAVLDIIISHYLFTKFPFKDEGFLTKLRSRLVSRQTLNQLGLKIGLKELIEANLNKVSKTVYGDALEALIGAIYLDRGFSYAQTFVLERLIDIHIDMNEVAETETDFKSRVIEWAQKEKQVFEFISSAKEEGENKYYLSELLIDGKLKGTGKAFTKKKAEQLAAEQFYQKIEQK